MVKAYNCEQGWLGDHEVLTTCAVRSGLPEDEAKDVLADPAISLEALEADLHRSERLGVSGVPFFVVDDRQTVGGAIPPEAFLKYFKAVAGGRTEA